MMDSGNAFIEYSRTLLTGELFPRIRGSVGRLSESDVWWRPNQASNSVGNLLLHLSGNVRQWIVSGIGGAEDVRRREEEFAATGALPVADLLHDLENTVAEADATLARLDPATLLELRDIQGRQVTVLEAIYHVVEHFSMHTGQIVYVTKMRLGEDLGFYQLEDGIPRAQWAPMSPERPVEAP